MNSLARDEYHERTASKDIKLVLPKYITEKNMESVAHFAPLGAMLRLNFIQEILGIKELRNNFPTKGCTSNFLNESEGYVFAFQ